MIETIIEKFAQAIPWIFSGLGIKIYESITEENSSQSQTNYQFIVENTCQPEIQEIKEPYAARLGRKLQSLREKNLNLTENQMRNFLGYTKVAELKKYEKGEDEFPQESIDKLEKFFFINRSFLEDGYSRIFRSIDVYSEEVRELLKNNFKIKFLCCPFNRDYLYTYPVFCKKEDGYSRIVVASQLGYFMSNGGGRNNIERIIREMLRRGIKSYEASILEVSEKTWQQLRQGTFYSNNLYFGLGQDDECRDIFDQWFEKIENEMYPERSFSITKLYEAIYGSKD